MLGTIIAALITGTATILAVIITNSRANAKMQSKADVSQAVMEEKISELTREVRMHNDFARRIPIIDERLKVINHRIEDLEGFHKPQN